MGGKLAGRIGWCKPWDMAGLRCRRFGSWESRRRALVVISTNSKLLRKWGQTHDGGGIRRRRRRRARGETAGVLERRARGVRGSNLSVRVLTCEEEVVLRGEGVEKRDGRKPSSSSRRASNNNQALRRPLLWPLLIAASCSPQVHFAPAAPPSLLVLAELSRADRRAARPDETRAEQSFRSPPLTSLPVASVRRSFTALAGSSSYIPHGLRSRRRRPPCGWPGSGSACTLLQDVCRYCARLTSRLPPSHAFASRKDSPGGRARRRQHLIASCEY